MQKARGALAGLKVRRPGQAASPPPPTPTPVAAGSADLLAQMQSLADRADALTAQSRLKDSKTAERIVFQPPALHTKSGRIDSGVQAHVDLLFESSSQNESARSGPEHAARAALKGVDWGKLKAGITFNTRAAGVLCH